MATHTTLSIVKAFDLMQIVCSLPRSSSLRNVATAAGMSLATTHRILVTLKSLGAIHVAPDGGYELGRTLCDLRSREIDKTDEIRALVERRLDEAASRLRMTMRISMLDDQDMLCFLAGSDAPGDPTAASRVIGGHFEAYLHAPGKLLLAQLGQGRISDYIASAPLLAATPKTIVEPRRLCAELRDVQTTGYAFEDEEFVTGEEAIAVPLVDAGGRIVAALSASRPLDAQRCLGRRLEELHRTVAAISDDLSGSESGVASLLCLADPTG